MWQYNYTNEYADYSCELYHYGVPGMKWGVRRKRAAVRAVANLRARNKLNYDDETARLQDKYGHKEKKLARKQSINKAGYDRTETLNKYAQMKKESKLDKSIKKTDEYKQARSAARKKMAQVYLLGISGSDRRDARKARKAAKKN